MIENNNSTDFFKYLVIILFSSLVIMGLVRAYVSVIKVPKVNKSTEELEEYELRMKINHLEYRLQNQITINKNQRKTINILKEVRNAQRARVKATTEAAKKRVKEATDKAKQVVDTAKADIKKNTDDINKQLCSIVQMLYTVDDKMGNPGLNDKEKNFIDALSKRGINTSKGATC